MFNTYPTEFYGYHCVHLVYFHFFFNRQNIINSPFKKTLLIAKTLARREEAVKSINKDAAYKRNIHPLSNTRGAIIIIITTTIIVVVIV